MYDIAPTELEGETVLKAIMKLSDIDDSDRGIGLFIDDTYSLKHHFRVDEANEAVNLHEFNTLPENRTLVAARGERRWTGEDLGLDLGEKVLISSNGFREVDTLTGKVMFSWSAEAHIPLTESTFPRWDPWDAFHMNSIDKNADGDYLVSFRHLDAIMLVSGDDGHIIWRLGGKESDYVFDDGLVFSRQHHARFVSHDEERTVISFLDNASGEDDRQEPSNEYSRGLILELVRPSSDPAGSEDGSDGPWRASLLREFPRPDGGLTHKRGNLQRLDNGNVFMAWTDAGYLSEHDANGTALMEARFLTEDRLGTYRAYKSDRWVGRPNMPPDIKAYGYGTGLDESTTAIYVSWKGATEHRFWEFYSDGELLGPAIDRTGFETVYVTTNRTGMVRAKAIDAHGEYLGESVEVPTEYA